jgi:subtilisin family serine protease
LRADFSSYGTQLDFWAPGQYIPTTVGSGFGRFSGTSAASPVLAGVVAQIYGKTPAVAAGAVERLLRDSSDKLTSDPRLAQGYGRVNAYKVLALAEAKKADSAKPTVSFKISSTVQLVRDPWGKVSVEVNAADNQYLNKVELYLNDSTTPLDVLSMPGYVFQFVATPYAGKAIYLTAKAYDLAGNVASTAKTAFLVQ